MCCKQLCDRSRPMESVILSPLLGTDMCGRKIGLVLPRILPRTRQKPSCGRKMGLGVTPPPPSVGLTSLCLPYSIFHTMYRSRYASTAVPCLEHCSSPLRTLCACHIRFLLMFVTLTRRQDVLSYSRLAVYYFISLGAPTPSVAVIMSQRSKYRVRHETRWCRTSRQRCLYRRFSQQSAGL